MDEEISRRLNELQERISELEEENRKLKQPRRERLTNRKIGKQVVPKVDRFTLKHDPMAGELMMHIADDGEYVRFEDYAWMSAYADRLVEFGNMPCLPKDLENLREANAAMAIEIDTLRSEIEFALLTA